jgi:hypothetical protein
VQRFHPHAEQLETRDVPTITTLSVENTLPFARVDEPVTSGVPLPGSQALRDTSQLRLLDSTGRPVPAQFRVLGRWNAPPEDATRPIKWLEVHFDASVPASSTATYTLDVGGTGNAPAALQATQTDGFIDITTGPARFQIDRTSFDLFHAAWLDLDGNGIFEDSEQIVAPGHPGGSYVLHGGTEFDSDRQAPRSVVLEESGPLRAVVRAEGFHTAPDGTTLLRYVTQLTFFAGQSYVQVNHDIIEGRVLGSGNDDLLDANGHFTGLQQVTNFDDAGLRVNLQLQGPETVRARGAQDAVPQATLAAGGSAALVQHRVTRVNTPMAYDLTENGTTAESGTQATRAWLDLSDSRWGLAVATHDFVQKNPEALRADATGAVRVEFPAEPYTIYQGMGLAETATFYFHAATATTDQLRQVLEGLAKDQLLAVAPPAWMVGSGALGDLPPANLPAPYNTFDTLMEDSYNQTVAYISQGHATGLLNYLDLPTDQFDRPANPDLTGWGNSYYDPAGAWLKQFARTGATRWLKVLAIPYVQHFYTTDAYDTDDSAEYQDGIGGARGAYHRAAWTGEYHYLESVWPYYYLTGDRRALERGQGAARSYATAPQWDVNFDLGTGVLGNTSRIIAQKFNTLLEAWLAGGGDSLKAALDDQIDKFFRFRFSPEGFLLYHSDPPTNPYVTDQAWMTTHLMDEALYKYFQVTGDARARNFVVIAPQRILQYQRASQDPTSPNFFTFYNNVRVTVGSGGQITTQEDFFGRPPDNPDNLLYPAEVMGLGTALARAGKVSGDASLLDQARTLYQFELTQVQPALWDKVTAKTTLRALDGLGLLVGAAPPPANQPPVLNSIGPQSVTQGSLLTFTAQATDADGDRLTYSLDGGAPNGAAIDPTSGAFSWTPTAAQGPGTFPITVRVTDNGTPALSASETVRVTVNGRSPSAPPPAAMPLPPIPTPTVRPIAAHLVTVRVGKKKRLVVQVFFADTGAKQREFASPFQSPHFKGIQVAARDSDGDGVPDLIVVTARKGKKAVTATFPG